MVAGEGLKKVIPKLKEVTKSTESEFTEVPKKSFFKSQKD